MLRKSWCIILTLIRMVMGNNKCKKGLQVLSVVLCVALLLGGAIYFGAKTIFPLHYEAEIQTWSEEFGVDSYLIMGIIRAESSFQAGAVSSANAMGLMQLTEETATQIAQWLEVEDFKTEQLFESDCNIRFGTRYVQWLLEQFDGNLKNTLAAYNAGIGTVKGWLADSRYCEDGVTLHTIPFRETADFVKRVTTYKEAYRILYPA